MKLKFAIISIIGLFSILLAACSTSEKTTGEETAEPEEKQSENIEETDVDYAAVFSETVAELAKASEGEEVDYEKVITSYEANLQELVQKRDEEFDETIDEHISTALQAGKEGTMDKVVVKQLYDKLMQKVFFLTIRHEFAEVTESWGNKEVVNEEIIEAKEFYNILKTTVEKRDAAYGTAMVDAITGGFSEIEASVEADDQLAFNLGKQVVDKTLMKTFYYAAGAKPNGYATKAANAAKENAEEAKVQQAEGWAFYQAVYPYIARHAEEDAAFIQSQFDLQTDVTALNPEEVNKAFVRGFAKVALHEYEESVEVFGEDKSVITALEGALFIDIIGEDIKALIGEEGYAALTEKAQAYLNATQSGDKANGEALVSELEAVLTDVINKAK